MMISVYIIYILQKEQNSNEINDLLMAVETGITDPAERHVCAMSTSSCIFLSRMHLEMVLHHMYSVLFLLITISTITDSDEVFICIF